jgi:hypothetical protein
MVEMAMRHQYIFDVGEIDADLAEICDQLIDMRLMQGVNQHHAVAGLDRPGRDPAHANEIDVIERLPGLDVLRFGIAQPAAEIRGHPSGAAEILEARQNFPGGAAVERLRRLGCQRMGRRRRKQGGNGE